MLSSRMVPIGLILVCICFAGRASASSVTLGVDDPLVMDPASVSDPLMFRVIDDNGVDPPQDFMTGWELNLRIVPDAGSTGTLTFNGPLTGRVDPEPDNYIFESIGNFGIQVDNLGTEVTAYDFNFPYSGGAQVPNGTGTELFSVELAATEDAAGDFGVFAVSGPGHTSWVDAGEPNQSRREFANVLDDVTMVRLTTVSVAADDSPAVIPGDANLDLQFGTDDIIAVLGAGKFETGLPATWAEGDWDGAPDAAFTYATGPPPGDGVFNTNDIIVALGSGAFETGPIVAALGDAGINVNSVPEPSTLVLAGLGILIGLASRRRRG